MDELKIIKYLDGDMSGDELAAFEDEIRMHPHLAEEIEKYRQVQDLARKLLADQEEHDQELAGEVHEEISQAVEDFKKDNGSYDGIQPEFREKLQEAERNFMENRDGPDSIRMIRRIWYSAAAVVILAIVLSLIIFRPFTRMSADEIYAQFFSTFHQNDAIMELVRDDNDFLFATEVYEAGDYERAAVLFEILADSSELRYWSLFYAGSSYMSSNQTSLAIELFDIILLEGNEEVAPAAHWQLVLCYLRIGDTVLAKEHLEILLENPGYSRDAKKVLRILD